MVCKYWRIYDPSSMQEKHEFGLVVASSSSEAKLKPNQNG